MRTDPSSKKEHSTISTRTHQIENEIRELSARDLQFWSIGFLTIVLAAAIALCFVVPNLVWRLGTIRIEQRYLPELLFSLVSLVLLFNLSLLAKKVSLSGLRRTLIAELALSERLESLSLVDPVTQLLNRRGINQLIPKEIARSNRMGGNLTFMKIDITGFNEINAKFGESEGNSLLSEFGKMLKSVFRGGDTVFRQSEHEFLVVMPDTNEQQCEPPLQRLLSSVDQWNVSNSKPYEMSLRWAFAAYATGSDFEDILRVLDRKMYVTKNTLVAAFSAGQ
jgi:diguanylate cyclase (GGDEF)-like protein